MICDSWFVFLRMKSRKASDIYAQNSLLSSHFFNLNKSIFNQIHNFVLLCRKGLLWDGLNCQPSKISTNQTSCHDPKSPLLSCLHVGVSSVLYILICHRFDGHRFPCMCMQLAQQNWLHLPDIHNQSSSINCWITWKYLQARLGKGSFLAWASKFISPSKGNWFISDKAA